MEVFVKKQTGLEQVAEKILAKLDAYVDVVEADKLTPQAMKHISATLKDLRELTELPQLREGTEIRVEFPEENWQG